MKARLAWPMLLAVVAIPMFGAETAVLSSSNCRAVVSKRTGQLVALEAAKGASQFVNGACDLYTLTDKLSPDETSDETRDCVGTTKSKDGEWTFECTNPDFPWLKIRKSYSLRENLLSKTTEYQSSENTGKLFAIQSKVVTDPSMRGNRSCFLFPPDESYRLPYPTAVKAFLVKQPVAFQQPQAMCLFTIPEWQKVLGHYLYQVNGKIAYCGASTVPGCMNPDGWTLGMANDFLRPDHGLRIATHLTIVNGDARDFHQQYYSLPEFVEFRKIQAPPVVKDLLMFFDNAHFYHALPESENYSALYTQDHLERATRALPNARDKGSFLLVEPCTTGDYPFKDTVYYGGQDGTFDHTVSVPRFREVIQKLQAQFPPIKFGIYSTMMGVSERHTFAENHPEWLSYGPDEKPTSRTKEIGLKVEAYAPDWMAPGLRQYWLRQYEHLVDVLGTDFVFIDGSPSADINWKAKGVTTTADWIEQVRNVHAICQRKGVFLFVNSAWSPLLFSDIGFFENYMMDQLEEEDWRKIAYASYLCKLIRLRPGGQVVGAVGGPAWDRHLAAQGVQAIANPGNSLSSVKAVYVTAMVRLSRELFDAVSVPFKVRPSWWDDEKTDLEIATLQKGDAFVFPMIWHGKNPGTQEISFDWSRVPVPPKTVVLIFETEWVLPAETDLTKPPPGAQEILQLKSARVEMKTTSQLTHAVLFSAHDQLKHLVVSTVPGFVESVNRERCLLPLPENHGVRLTGTAAGGTDSYQLLAASETETAQVFLWKPAEWPGAQVKLNGPVVPAETLDVGGVSFLRVVVPRGLNKVVVARGKDVATVPVKYTHPTVDSWNLLAASFYYRNARFKTFVEAGHNVLELTPIAPGECSVIIHTDYPPVKSAGLTFAVAGADNQGSLAVDDTADLRWGTQLNFEGWKTFTVEKKAGADSGVYRMRWLPNPGAPPLRIRDWQLLPNNQEK